MSLLGEYLYCQHFHCIHFLPAVTNGQILDCNFDDDNLCSWSQVTGSDNVDWNLRQGPTPSSFTGPPYDHTTNSTSTISINQLKET